MEIGNKTLILAIIIIGILVWFVVTTKKDISRYRNIVDKYLINDEDNKPKQVTKKPAIKKVTFKDTEE